MKDLLIELEKTKADLISAISTIGDEQFNTIPYPGGWTAAQVSEHVLKAVGVDMLYDKTKPTDRAPDEKVKQTADMFLNLDIKMQSPDFIYPSDEPHVKADMLAQVEDKFSKLIEAAKTLDLSLTCLAFEVPGFGEFTRLEFIWFYIVHTQRHIFQFKKVANALNQ
ncbi:MAG: DinB family protein [Bacteroidota bacterium]